MLIVVSPAKSLNMDPVEGVAATRPDFQPDAERLAKTAGRLSQKKLRELMSISADLAKLNSDRFKAFGEMDSKPAALAFNGDTYQGLEAGTLDADEMAWAQDHLRILSGLYGVLRPLDDIQPYRLEMGSRLKTRRGANLYKYWGDRIAKSLNAQAEATGAETLVNCASQEYFVAVDLNALKLQVITPSFLEDKNGTPKMVSFFAKKARGAMARYIIQHRLSDPEALKDFDSGGYAYRADLSEENSPVFVRDYPTS